MPRSSMAAIISRVRLLINDTLPAGQGQIFSDDQIQDILDSSRMDVRNKALRPERTFSGTTIQYVDYYASWTDWEDDLVLKQNLTILETPATSENIVGHWTFTASVLPPVFITGKTYDRYRAAADLLEMWAAMLVLNFDVVVGGQTFKQSQAPDALAKLSKSYRMKQRAGTILTTRSDLKSTGDDGELSLKATAIDYMSSGGGE